MIAGIVTVALVYAPAVPIPLKALGINPYLSIVNIMACRVFRNTRAGSIRESQISTSVVVEEMMGTPHRVIISIGQDTQTVRDAVKPESSINSSKVDICWVDDVLHFWVCVERLEIDPQTSVIWINILLSQDSIYIYLNTKCLWFMLRRFLLLNCRSRTDIACETWYLQAWKLTDLSVTASRITLLGYATCLPDNSPGRYVFFSA